MIKKALGLSVALLVTQGAVAGTGDAAVSIINSFEQLFGVTEGERRNHTKGFCFSATLTPADEAIKNYSNSPIFTGESIVIGRLSHKGGNYKAADDKPSEYGMGLFIGTTSGETHLMAMNTLDFFPVATPEAFAELMVAKTQGAEAVKAFKKKNVELQKFKAHMAKKTKVLTSYEGNTYNSVNSFYLVDSDGNKTAVRWSFVPTQQQSLHIEPQQDFFFNNMQGNLSKQGAAWDMVITLANENDVVDNAAIQWQGEHQQIVAAQLNVVSISSEQEGGCGNINYDPLVLSTGFEPSGDPLLQARRDTYAISFGKRISEQ